MTTTTRSLAASDAWEPVMRAVEEYGSVSRSQGVVWAAYDHHDRATMDDKALEAHTALLKVLAEIRVPA